MSALQEMQDTYRAARSRLYGQPIREVRVRPASLFVAVPSGNDALPRNGTTLFYRKPRQVVDFQYALNLVCEDRGITPDQMLNSTYCAAVAARHMLWTVMADGGYSFSDIARRFAVDDKTVSGGIASFRQYQQGKI
jgi:hypothetical protein